MQLQKILLNIINCSYPSQFDEIEVQSISADSRYVSVGGMFVALRGAIKEGSEFISDAVKRGAKVIVAEKFDQQYGEDVCCVSVLDSTKAIRTISHNFYGDPSAIVKTIGVTGTNGKTTITYLLENVLQKSGKSTAVVGTINHRIKDKVHPSNNTTPGFLDNQKFLANLADKKIDYCLMEVSSHALDQGRVDLINFKSAIFTNLASDHLDYHKTRENYLLAKAKLFTSLQPSAIAIINGDDEFGPRLKDLTMVKTLTYGINKEVDLKAENIRLSIDKSEFELIIAGKIYVFNTPLIGLHNVYNILATLAVGISEGLSIVDMQDAIAVFSHVPGRLERANTKGDFTVFIDYAHTEDALLNVMRTIRQVSASKLIVVFGCGGDRDRTKRPKMAQVVSQWADHAFVTSDNPRNEEPKAIIDEICTGFLKNNFTVVIDRKEAIAKALKMAKKDDVVLVAGKGHETYQIFKDETIEFNERKIIEDLLKNDNK